MKGGRWWLWTNVVLTAGWSVMLVVCLLPVGPGPRLANSLTYLVAISHAALVMAGLAVLAGARAERAANGSEA